MHSDFQKQSQGSFQYKHFYEAGLDDDSKEIGSEQIPKSTIVAVGKVPGSEGNHGQTAKHRQYCVNVARLGSTQL